MMFGFRIIRAPNKGLVFTLGKPSRVLDPGIHWVSPMLCQVVLVSTALHTFEVDIDVITKGGTPTTIKVGYTARIVDPYAAFVNVADPFMTLRASVISVASGAANSYTIDQLAQYKSQIAHMAQQELAGLSQANGWGLGDFQIAIGDPSMSNELKGLLMREEAVRRENAANLERARNQLAIAQQLAAVAAQLEHSPFARELLRLQMIADMGAGGKVIVVDSQSPSAKAVAMQASGQQPLAPQATHHTQPVYPQTT
ncbi:MAG TPA: SPFH domain-containing protein [Polyangiaceae bacterium]|nr:SPFH domain-containing protein [Polyangiaceae bacterium]